jgi:DNA-binding NarL/FixJ family response regulator
MLAADERFEVVDAPTSAGAADGVYERLCDFVQDHVVVSGGKRFRGAFGPALTAREEDVFEHLVRGRSNRQIAELLRLTESTVKSHVHHIFAKFGVGSRNELFGRAIELGRIQVSDP